jgi:hypothetical protein
VVVFNSVVQDKQSRLQVGLLLSLSVFVLSPFVYSLGFRAIAVIPISMVLFIAILTINNKKIPIWTIYIVLLSFLTSSITGFYWVSWKASLFPAFFGMSMLIASIATKSELEETAKFGSVILMVILIGSWIAFFFAAIGIEPAGIFYTPSGRAIEYYYTSFAIPYNDSFIRPTGLYDEPGTLSLIVCIFAFIRHMLGLNKKFTWALLLLGFVTFSLAHLIYVAFHALSEKNIFRTIRNIILVGSLFIVFLSVMGVWPVFEERLIGRLAISPNTERIVVGDNRTQYIISSSQLLRTNFYAIDLMFGVDESCIEGKIECGKHAPKAGFNLLSPLIHYGLLISWPYYLFIGFAFLLGISNRTYYALFAVGLLFMQRPYAFSSGYAMLCALTIFAVLHSSRYKWMIGNIKSTLYNRSN